MRKYFWIFPTLMLGSFSPLFSASQGAYTLPDIIQLSIQNNIEVKLAQAKTEEAKGKALQKASMLLPHFMGSVSQSRVFKENLEAMGFSAGEGIDTLLGPFNVFDARLSLSQKLFDLGDVWKYKESSQKVTLAQLQESLVKEQVAATAALAYLDVIRARRSLTTAQSDFSLAESLFRLSDDQHQAGLATGVDVVRAKTRMEEAHLKVIKTRTMERQVTLRLARVTGLPFDDPAVLSDKLEFSSATTSDINGARNAAQLTRIEIKMANAYLQASQDSLKAAKSGHAPSLVAAGDYGLSGNNLSNSEKTGSIGARLDVPIFSGRHTEGNVIEMSGQLVEAEARRNDIERQVEEDVRLSVEMLKSETEEVSSANQTVALAEREMQMAKDRYAAGVGDNIQVITAQAELAQAHENQTNALTAYIAARVNYEMSIGHVSEFKLN